MLVLLTVTFMVASANKQGLPFVAYMGEVVSRQQLRSCNPKLLACFIVQRLPDNIADNKNAADVLPLPSFFCLLRYTHMLMGFARCNHNKACLLLQQTRFFSNDKNENKPLLALLNVVANCA